MGRQTVRGQNEDEKEPAPVYLPLELRREIEAWKVLSNPQSSDALMFPSEVGTPVRGGNFLRRHVKPLALRLGIDPSLVTFAREHERGAGALLPR
jgi:hypothetical protein